MDTHHIHLQDPLAMERINVRARSVTADLNAMFHRFDAERFRWLAEQLRDAGCPEAARLAADWGQEHLDTAARLDGQAGIGGAS